MERNGRGPAGETTSLHAKRRRWRLVPPAITPVKMTDVAAGIHGQLRGVGRDQFRRDIETMLEAENSATYTSFRRTLAGCFHELADGERTRVLIPAFCSSDFPDAIEGVGLEPVRYDIDPSSLSLDMTSLQSKLGPETLAVVVINVLGYGSPVAELQSHLENREIFLVEALGYALGAQYNDQPLGTFGDCAVLNFQQGKPVPVGGGMVVNHNPALAFGEKGRPTVDPNYGAVLGYTVLGRPRPYHAYYEIKDVLDRNGALEGRTTIHPESKLEVEYDPPFGTISNFQGTIGRRILDRLDRHRHQRTQTANYYVEKLRSCPRVESLEPIEGLSKHQHVRFPLRVETEDLRNRIREALLAAGIQATTLYDWPVLDPEAFPGASELQRAIITLPTHPYVDAHDRQLVVDTIRDVVENSPNE